MNWWRQLVCYTRNYRGLRSWHRAQGRDHRESPLLWLRKAVPEWRLSLCQGRGQAWAHRPSWYLSATWQVLNMSCYCFVLPSQFVKGNSVKVLGRVMLRPWERPSSVVSAFLVVCTYTVHIASPPIEAVDWSDAIMWGQQETPPELCIG